MKTKRGLIKYTEALTVITIWLLVFAAPMLIFQLEGSIIWSNVFLAWMGVLPFFLLFMVNHVLLVPLLLFRNKQVLYLISVIVLLFAFSFSTFIIEGSGQPNPGQRPLPGHLQQPLPQGQNIGPGPGSSKQQPPPGHPINFPPFINTIIISILVIGFDTGLRMISRWSKLEKERTLLEKENVQNQLAFLRNQVSPHFFMNTLNNIHSLIDIDTEEAKDSIIKLSKLMRHLLYESEAEQTPLKKEVEFIRSYINLMKLRFTDKVEIEVAIPGNLPDKTIPPLLFTSLIENAFKHGISYKHPSFIRINISMADGRLNFDIANSKQVNDTNGSSNGIGLKNTRQRLDLLYAGDYTFDIMENENEFAVKLSLPV
jgi:two-component sensor histidine kinase